MENLVDDKSKLPSLLYHRVKFEPEDWALFDNSQIASGYDKGSLELEFNPSCVVMVGGNYGKLVQWNKEAAHEWRTIGFPKARLILEAQKVLMRFLRNTMDHLLQGAADGGGAARLEQQYGGGTKVNGQQEFWSPYSKQPFAAPPQFDPDGLLEMCQTRLAAVEDEIRLLQVDAKYAQHILDGLLKLDMYKEFNEEERWMFLAGELVSTPMKRVQMLRYLVEEFDNIRELYHKHRKHVSPDQFLPQAYTLAIAATQRFLINILDYQTFEIERILPTVPGFQNHYEYRKVDIRGGTKQTEIIRKIVPYKYSQTMAYFYKDPLYWAVYQLRTNPAEQIEWNRAFFFNFIDEHLADTSAKEKARIDQRLYDYLSDMAGNDILLSALRCHRPVASTVSLAVALESQHGRGGSCWPNCVVEPVESLQEHKHAMAVALHEFAQQRWPKGRKNAAWLQQATQTRRALADLWNANQINLRSVLKRMPRLPRTEEHIEAEFSMARADMTPEYLAGLEAERLEISKAMSSDTTEASSGAPQYAHAEWNIDTQKAERAIETKTKAKPKTRPQPDDTSLSSDSGPFKTPATAFSGSEVTTTAATSILVNAESTRTFASVLFAENAPRVIKWQRFVAAMVDAGCSATNNGGSAVTFKHAVGSMVFHRPHPEPEIDPIVLHSMGQRLKWRFGWGHEVFVERKKVTA